MPDTLGAFIELFRDFTDDGIEPYLWSDKEITRWLNWARRQFCEKAEAIVDFQTVDETLATATVTLTGTAGQIDKVEINGVEITSGAVVFDSDLPTTAAALAHNINSHTSSPNYTAQANGASVTISSVAGTGATPNGYAVVTTCSGGDLAAASTALAGGNSLCELYIVPGKALYAVDNRILSIRRVKLASMAHPLLKTTKDRLDRERSSWQTSTGQPNAYLDYSENGYIVCDRIPEEPDTVELEVSRLPLADLVPTSKSSLLEIASRYTETLLDGVLSRAYLKNDAETLREKKATEHMALWENKLDEITNRILRRGETTDMEPHEAFLP